MPVGSVIVVTHNSANCIEACLSSLLPAKTWRIVLVDNASTDKTVYKARRLAPELSIQVNRQNVGFGAAVNQGCRIADGNVFLILNPDIAAQPHSLDKLLEAVSADGVGAAGGLLAESSGQAQVGFTLRRFPTLASALAEVMLLNRLWPNNSINRKYRCLDLDHSKVQEVEQPAGACLAIMKEAWKDVGGFDESFFPVWFEDVDFCRRLHDRGWKIVFCPEAAFAHIGGHSVRQLNFRDRQTFWYRNLLRYFAKHHPYWQLVVLRMGVVAGLLLRSLLSLVRLHPAALSIRESVSAYGYVMWHYAVRGRDLRPSE